MQKQKLKRAERRHALKDARQLLQSSRFFYKFLKVVKKAGLVGEEQNALVLLIVVMSRILPRPLNAFVKGRSSAGKNFLVKVVLRFVPRRFVREMSSASDQAWSYSGSDFRHCVVYIQEQNEAAGTIDPLRQLISEGKLIRMVPQYQGGRRVTKKQIAHGPVAAISTTTRDRLKIDDETRHISIRVDESREQTRRIVKAYSHEALSLSRRELLAWRMVHRLVQQRDGTNVKFPKWFDAVAERLFVDDLRVRRYYPAFVEACRTVCIIRSFLPGREISDDAELELDFADFAITSLIFEKAFVESLHLAKGAGEAIRKVVADITESKHSSATAKDVASTLELSLDRAYAKLRYAEKAGVIRRANKPEKSNRKRFIAAPQTRFVPDPEKLFHAIERVGHEVMFRHPITGEPVIYRRSS